MDCSVLLFGKIPDSPWLPDLFLKSTYSRTLVTRTLTGNEKRFELAGNLNYRG